ncbi:hypothetical protein CBR_g37269 [Chara braunii]|uniref:Uncharacterized protein n=1 Tax=Chara braunii TaxID=69332 RepID=A0A388LMX2_CHABU|nr:hypothetical protein CBR_g37269 [Chara braunii]|eukprot:GBG83552.1 hypothetical protein CBR_g37269 [Chara braunii]
MLVTIKSFAGYSSNMTLCSHFKGLCDGGSKRLPSPEQYLDLALMVPKERSVLSREHVFRLLPPHEGSSGLAQETPGAAVGRGSPIQDAGGRVKGRARSVHMQVGPDAPGNTSDLHSQGTRTQRVGTPKLIKVRCGGDTYPLQDETRRESGRSGQDVGGNEAEGMGAVRESSGGEQTPSEKKRERQRMVREEVAEETLRMKRMRGKSEAMMGGDGGDVGEGGSGKRPRKTAEAASGGERPAGEECGEAAAFWLEYERNNGGEIVEKELPVQLLIDPKKVCDIPSWKRYYNHRTLNRETVDDIKVAMLSQFRENRGKIWTKNPLVLTPIYKPVTRRPEKADKVHKDVFKPEDKDKYYYYPVNGQHTVAAVKELEGEPIFDLWKMHSWSARVVWFSERDFAGYRQVSLNENTRHKMPKQRSQKAAFLDMRGAWEKEGRPMAIQGNPSGKEAEKRKFFEFQKLILENSPNESHWELAEKDLSLPDKEYVAAVGNALRQWMPLVTAGDDVFRKAMEFYAKLAEGKLLGGNGKTPLSRSGKHMPDKSPGLQAIPEMGSKWAAGETNMGGWSGTEVWDFLFQPGPPGPTDLEYSRRRNLVFGVLNGYHDAPKEFVSHFLRRLEHVYFTLAKPLTLENYKSQFDEEDPFDAEDMEELSDSETFDFQSMPLPRVVGQVGDEEEGAPRRYSTYPAGLKRVFRGELVDDQSSDDGEEDKDYDHEPCDRLPEDHDTWQNDGLYFFCKHHRFTPEDVWGHNVVWHPRIFQPAVRNGMWVMAMKEADGKWSGLKRLGAGAFKRIARSALVEHLSLMNPERNDPDVGAYAEQKLNELYANSMLQFRAPFYTLETTPSRGIDWRMPQPPSGGQHPGGGGGGD